MRGRSVSSRVLSPSRRIPILTISFSLLVLCTLAASSLLAQVGPNPAWVERWDGPGHSNDAPAAMASDAAGNVYVTGVTCV
jgi:hypothetical protein